VQILQNPTAAGEANPSIERAGPGKTSHASHLQTLDAEYDRSRGCIGLGDGISDYTDVQMTASIESVIVALQSLIPSDDDSENVRRLYEIFAGFRPQSGRELAMPAMFALLERFPDAELVRRVRWSTSLRPSRATRSCCANHCIASQPT